MTGKACASLKYSARSWPSLQACMGRCCHLFAAVLCTCPQTILGGSTVSRMLCPCRGPLHSSSRGRVRVSPCVSETAAC